MTTKEKQMKTSKASISLIAVTVAAALSLLVVNRTIKAQHSDLELQVDKLAGELEPRVIHWRRDFHQHPELSNREFRTAKIIAKHLESLGIETTTGIAHTGVIGVLKGGRGGPVVALRADMDALPVTERVDVPFASKESSEYNGVAVGVMHACGHDTHMAILMGVAQVLASLRAELPGTVKFIFQPAEEGAPKGEEGGAQLMVKEGVLQNPRVDAIFGLHIDSKRDVNTIGYRPEGLLAAADNFRIKVKGKQTHGSQPWSGIDPIVVSAQIITALQTIVSRQVDLTESIAVISVGSLHSGVRSNIIPENAEMVGTIRTLDPQTRKLVHERIRKTAVSIAESAGAQVEVDLPLSVAYPVTFNDPELVDEMLPTLQETAGKDRVELINPITGAEDFSFFAEKVPGFFFFLGGKPMKRSVEDAAAHHTPDFYIDEGGLVLGVRSLARLAINYLEHRARR